MGKKKSVVLMALLTIVIAVLCVITAFPTFTLPFTNGIKSWNPAVMQYDLGMDLGGGYYAYYYPKGVISETEYKSNLSMLENAAADETLTADEKAEKQQEVDDYKGAYVQHGGLYLSTDPEFGLLGDDKKSLDPEFVEAFNAATEEISARYAAKNYDDYRVAVVDDCALRVELPASENTKNQTAKENATQALVVFALTGDMNIKVGGEVVEQLKDDDTSAKDLIKSIKVKTQYEVVYLQMEFTSAGKEMLEDFKSKASSSSTDSTTGESTETTMDICIGDETMLSIKSEHVDENRVKYTVAEEADKRYVETLAVLLNSVMKNDGFDVEFETLSSSEVREFAPTYNKNVLMFQYAALASIIVGLLVFAIVKTGRFGVVNAYVSLSYVSIVGICYAFISKGVLAVTPGSALIFLIGLVLVNVMHHYVYNAIKGEFALGKTVESSVKNGYKKTLWVTIDVYAVLLLGAAALLVGTAGLHAFAIQALVCVLAGAFCSLLWSRTINYTLLSASKNKYKYYRLVREEDDDDE